MKGIFCWVWALVFAFSAAAIRAEPTLLEETRLYDIQGLSKNELRGQMKRLGQEGYAGYTRSRINYRYKNRTDGNACLVDSVNVVVRIEYTMPRWANKFQASRALRDEWDTYYRCLDFHEKGHKEIALKNARLMEQWILRAGSSSCKTLDEQCKEVCRVFLELMRQEDVEYDRITNHGRTQGAYLR